MTSRSNYKQSSRVDRYDWDDGGNERERGKGQTYEAAYLLVAEAMEFSSTTIKWKRLGRGSVVVDMDGWSTIFVSSSRIRRRPG